MSKPNHTPGPWKVRGMISGDIDILNEQNHHIATMRSYEETKANAALVASAPELLEALESLMQIMGADNFKQKPMGPNLRLKERRILARQAIKKAKGGGMSHPVNDDLKEQFRDECSEDGDFLSHPDIGYFEEEDMEEAFYQWLATKGNRCEDEEEGQKL